MPKSRCLFISFTTVKKPYIANLKPTILKHWKNVFITNSVVVLSGIRLKKINYSVIGVDTSLIDMVKIIIFLLKYLNRFWKINMINSHLDIYSSIAIFLRILFENRFGQYLWQVHLVISTDQWKSVMTNDILPMALSLEMTELSQSCVRNWCWCRTWVKKFNHLKNLFNKYTNPAKGILDFCKQKLTAPPMAMVIQWIVPFPTSTRQRNLCKCWIVWNLKSEIWILNENDKNTKPTKPSQS